MTAAWLILAGALGAAAQVELRSGQGLPAPELIAATPRGAVVGEGGRPAFLIGWDRVLRVGGPAADEAGPFLAVGESLWRARARLERGDAAGAEPIFEHLMPSLAETGGPMAAVAAEGLLRCRLRRGAQVGGVEPWLEWLAARQIPPGGPTPFATDWAARAGLEPIFDTQTGLAPALPPMWVDWPAVRIYATGPTPTVREGRSATVNAMEALYLHAARFEAGIDAPFPKVAGGDQGVALVSDLVLARAGAYEERHAARDRLRQRLAAAPSPWMEAWCRAGIGRSLIREDDPETRRLGVVELVHLPARLGAVHPYLAGLCLAEAADARAGLGDRAGSERLWSELKSTYPDHPVLAWDRMRTAGMERGGAQVAAVIPLVNTECLIR